MPTTPLTAYTATDPVVAVAATAVATPAPTDADDGFDTGPYGTVRALLAYAGTVATCAVRLWVRDREGGEWFRAASTGELTALDPGGATPVNEARDWKVGRDAEVWFQVEEVSGGGTVEVRLQGVVE